MVTKRNLILVALVLLAVSCGGRRGGRNGDGTPEDSLATADAPVPEKADPKGAKADSLVDLKKVGALPEEPIFDIVTTMGTIRVKLYKDTPKHRDNFTKLALSHFYDDVLFHRVVDGFVIQGGDPYTRDTSRVAEWGEGGPGYNVDAEIVPEHTHKKGALAAARRSDFANPKRESSGSQFYLVQNADGCKHLDGKYTVFGETVGGLNVIDRIARVRVDKYDHPVAPVRIIRVRPNDQLNRRALEEEQRALQEALNPTPAEATEGGGENGEKTEEKPEDEKKPKTRQLNVQTEVDSTVLGGRKLKHRE